MDGRRRISVYRKDWVCAIGRRPGYYRGFFPCKDNHTSSLSIHFLSWFRSFLCRIRKRAMNSLQQLSPSKMGVPYLILPPSLPPEAEDVGRGSFPRISNLTANFRPENKRARKQRLLSLPSVSATVLFCRFIPFFTP